LAVGNLAPSLKELKYLRYLHYFPGPLTPETNAGGLYKFLVERGKVSLVWEVLSQIFTVEKGNILEKLVNTIDREVL
jgi:hypothetical protein